MGTKQETMQTYTFPNGLRVLCIPNDRPTVYCGLMLNVGTRHENEGESGMAHCVEHMTFKGTERRTAMQILNRMESVGGETNAFTSKQETVYYCSCLREHMPRAIDWLFDVVFHSIYPQDALDREVEVIIDEIESYNDNPSELIYDDFESILFNNHPLGRSILGDADNLRSYKSSDLVSFANRLYHPDRAVLFVMGDVSIEQVVKVAESSVAGIPIVNSQQPTVNPQWSMVNGQCGSVVRNKNTHQAHVVVGTEAVSIGDESFMGLLLLNNILGGVGMNSRLNISLRERRGLVYTVGSSLIGYADTGLWCVYMGCDTADINRCLRIVNSELKRLNNNPLSDRVLRAAIRQMKGQMAVSHDSFENVAIGTAKRFLHTGCAYTLDDMFSQLDALTPDYLHSLSNTYLCPDRMLTLIYK